jgi:hypothetical protein
MNKKIVYFNELSEQAKEKARQWWRDNNDYQFLEEELREFIAEEIKKLGFVVDDLDLFYSLSYSQGDGVSFTAKITKGLESYEVNRMPSNHCHKMTISEVYHETEDGEQTDEDELLKKMREIARKAEKIGYGYIEDENKDGNVDENILVNEYTFTLEGERMNPDNNN